MTVAPDDEILRRLADLEFGLVLGYRRALNET